MQPILERAFVPSSGKAFFIMWLAAAAFGWSWRELPVSLSAHAAVSFVTRHLLPQSHRGSSCDRSTSAQARAIWTTPRLCLIAREQTTQREQEAVCGLLSA